MKQEIILFDINETVLNLVSLKPKFEAAFNNEYALALWFSQLLHTSTVCISTKVATGFADLAGAMLDSIAVRFDVSLSVATKQDLLGSFASLQAHADIKPALSLLRDNGFRTVAFSNSSLSLLSAQIENAGLMDYFDQIISVEETGSFKPDPMVYKFAAKKLESSVGDLRLVATHDWDTHGALSAGLKAAYIDRSATPYHPLYLKPDIQANTMGGIAEQIIATAI
jgi:2-haloacid dehalogenase